MKLLMNTISCDGRYSVHIISRMSKTTVEDNIRRQMQPALHALIHTDAPQTEHTVLTWKLGGEIDQRTFQEGLASHGCSYTAVMRREDQNTTEMDRQHTPHEKRIRLSC